MEDDELEDLYNDVEETQEVGTEVEETAETEETYTSGIEKFLADYGVENGMITTVDENGNEVDVPFSELTLEEQYEVLQSITERQTPANVYEEELGFLNELKKEGLSLDEYIKQQVAALNNEVGTIASMSDDEVFLQNQKMRYPDLTDDELVEELEAAKGRSNFEKKVASARQELLKLEEQEISQQEAVARQEQQKAIEKAKSTLIATAVEIDTIAGFEFEEELKNRIIGQLVEFDDNTPSAFAQALNDPATLIKAAWYLNYGDAAIAQLNEYYAKEIKASYEKGKRDAVQGLSTGPVRRVGATATAGTAPKSNIATVEDLYD